MLYTNLKHIENDTEFESAMRDNPNVIIIFGNMNPESVSTFRIIEELDKRFTAIKFFDMEYNHPELINRKEILDLQKVHSIPLIVTYKNGEMVGATSGNKIKEHLLATISKIDKQEYKNEQ